MMRIILLTILGLKFTSALDSVQLVVEQWETWKLEHGKSYGKTRHGDNMVGVESGHPGSYGQEETFRMKIWMENKAKIARHNRRAFKGSHSYVQAMNSWGDMLHQEFVASLNGYRSSPANNSGEKPLGATFIPPAHVDRFPISVDWREHGAVTAVKNQGQCGSCWSFSATGALEAMHHRATGHLISLSEQNLVDCSGKYGNQGCNGGMMDSAFQYIKDNGGIDTEKAYPYEGENDVCRYDPKFKGAWDVGFCDIPQGDEHLLKSAIATQGPCSVAIDASRESFQFYKKGVYREEECSPVNLDHGVLAVGYGVDKETGEAYWLIKNSWGASWGDEGYVKIARNEDNMCGVASSASFPMV